MWNIQQLASVMYAVENGAHIAVTQYIKIEYNFT